MQTNMKEKYEAICILYMYSYLLKMKTRIKNDRLTTNLHTDLLNHRYTTQLNKK